MRTNLVQTCKKSANRINLNRITMRVALIGLFISLGIGNAWAGGGKSSNYYASLKISADGPTGAGKVYVTATKDSKPGTANPGTAITSASTSDSGGNVSLYYYIDINPGYNVQLSGNITKAYGSFTAANGTQQTFTAAAATSNGSTKAYEATATFVKIDVTAVDNTTINLNPTDPSAIYNYEVNFTVPYLKAIATDLTNSPTAASGKWTAPAWTSTDLNTASSTVKCAGSFQGDGTYGGLSRTNSTTISLQSKASSPTVKTCTVTANFPNAKVNSGSSDEIPASFKASDASQSDKAWTATFEVENVDGENNFDTPTFTGADASHFTYNSMSISGNVVTVNFTYNGNKEATTHTATLTLKVKDAIGGTDATYGSKSITVTAVNEEESDYDVEVRNAGGTLISNNTTTWAQGLSLANNNAGSTIKLMRDINLGTITATNNITEATTIDLNGKELRAAVNKSETPMLTFSASVTVKDSKTGGRIINEHALNGQLRTITVAGGTFTLESGTLAVHNTGQYASAAATVNDVAIAKYASCACRVLHQNAGTTVNINGGKLEAEGTRSVYGIVQGSSAATNKAGTTVLNVSGGEIATEAPYAAYGIYAYGKVNMSAGVINTHINTNMVDARYAADNANNQNNAQGYGIYMAVSSSATATSCYYGTLNMTGGTINVVSDRTKAADLRNYGIFLNGAVTGVGAGKTASDGTLSQKACAVAHLDGATVNVTSGTYYSYGVMANGSYNSTDNSHTVMQIKNSKFTVKAYLYTYGIYANANINSSTGGCYAADMELTADTVWAESVNTHTAYAVMCASTATTLYKNSTSVYYGEYAVGAKVTINSGKYTAKTKTTTAYAVASSTRSKSTYDPETNVSTERKLSGEAEAYAEVIIHGGTFRGEATTTTSRAVSSGGYTTIDGGTFEAYSGTTTSYGLYAVSGKLTASGVSVSASGTTTAYGVVADAGITRNAPSGFAYSGEVELNNCTITATSRTGATCRGVFINGTSGIFTDATFISDSTSNKWSAANAIIYHAIYPTGASRAIAGKATINGGSITANAATTDAYGIYQIITPVATDGVAKDAGMLSVKNATIYAESKGGNTAHGIYAGGKANIEGCTITAKTSAANAYGVDAYDDEVKVKKSTITTTAGTSGSYGILASGAVHSAGVKRESVMTVDSCTVTTTAGTTTSYAVYATGTSGGAYATDYYTGSMAVAGTITVNGGKYTSSATTSTAYAACVADPIVKNEATATPSVIINEGKFKGTAGATPYADVSVNGEPGYFVLNGGYYVKDENLDKKLGEGMNKVAVKSGTPEYTEGYRWRVTDNMTGEFVCKITQNSTSYASLEEALQVVEAAPSSTWTIVMIANATLSKGDYELPANTTLLIPYKSDQTTIIGTGGQSKGPSKNTETYEAPTPLYKLTFESGVNMTVKGTIEASAVTYMSNQGLTTHGTGVVSGKFGWLYLAEGAHIDLENNAKLIAWGFVTGKGEINAKNGSKIYEDFQIGDWRGGTVESDVMDNKNGLNSKSVFVITHYYYQNIECPITYRPGATAYGWGGTYMYKDVVFYTVDQIVPLTTPVAMVGTSDAMFLMDPATAGEDTWVRKEYDPETDYINWTMNSGASLGSIRIQLELPIVGDMDVDSKDYVLPITSNFNIIANYGDVELTNNVCFIPGSKLTIKKEAVLTIPSNQNVFFYDQDDWQKYGSYWFYPYYSPSWKKNPRTVAIGDQTKVKMPDAEVLVEGLLDFRGRAYTTAGGANIHSTRENAGRVKFTASAPASTSAVASNQNKNQSSTLFQMIGGGPDYEGKALTSAKLKNEDGEYTPTTGTAAGDIYAYMEDPADGVFRWLSVRDNGCFTEIKGASTKEYIHPSDFVAVEENANGDHAYHSEDGARMFINAKAATSDASCIWWEVDPTSEAISGTKYYVANNENFDNYGTYFYWDNSVSYWKPKKVTVLWHDENGNKIENGTFGDEYNFNTSPQFYGTNPTKANTAILKYNWIGWRDPEGNIYDKNATLPRATADITYTAYFETSKYQYTITFKNDDNTDLWAGLVDAGTTGAELQTLFETKYNEKTGSTIPLKAPSVDKVYTFDSWNTTLATVTAAATYTANYTWVTRKYHVTFYNYDAATVLYEADVDYNTRPVYEGVTPFRSNTSAFSYEWTGWQQGATHYGTTADLAFVTGDVYYVATFSQTTLKYQVLFKRQDGTIIDAPFFEYEETPAAFPANPTMASTVSTNYTFDHWDPAELVSVTEDGKVYTAYFSESPRQYTVHFVNYDGTSLGVDQTIDYNTVPEYTGATPFKPNDSRNSFEFSGWAWEAGADWEAGSIDAGEAFPAIKGEITFKAQFTETLLQFNVIYKREDGTIIEQQKKKWGETTAFPSVNNYEDETYSYTFDHWSPATVVTTVTADATYTAYFNQAIKTYSFSTIAATPAEYGSVSPASLASIPSGSAVTVDGNKITVNGTTITATPAEATAQYTYTFSHWNNVPATVTGNMSDIEAVFTRTVNQYEVTFNMKGYGAAISSQTKDYGSKVDQPADPSEAGYTFVGWYKESTCTNAWNFTSDEVIGSTTLFAKWTINQYTITFDTDGGSAVAPITQDYSSTVTPPANPTKEGYTFNGWLPAVPATMPIDGATCVAQWSINSYQIKFVDEDGTTNLGSYPQNLDYGAAVTAPEEPTKAADATNVYTFAGWSDGVSTYASADIPAVSGAVTYTATYNSAPTVASVTVSGTTTYYATLQDAFDYAQSKASPNITVLRDINLSTDNAVYTNSKKSSVVVFELNGHKVSGACTQMLYITGTQAFTFKIQDSSVGQTGQIYDRLSSNKARCCVLAYYGTVELLSGTIYMENYNTGSSVQAYGVQVRSGSGYKFNMKGGKIEVHSTKQAVGIYSAGTTTVSGGEIIVKETKNGYASGVQVINGTTTISDDADIDVSGTTNVRAVLVGGTTPSDKGALYNGKLYITDGKFTVNASKNTAYGVYSYGGTKAIDYATSATYAGNYACAGTADISGGEFEVTSVGTIAYGVFVKEPVAISSALQENGVDTYPEATATPKANITGGKFNISGTSEKGAVNTAAANTDLVVEGGWYNINTNLDGYTAPMKSCNYRVLDLAGEDPYKYEVAEAYTITFNNYDGTPLQSSAVKKDATPVYSDETPTKAEDDDYTYTFDGWDDGTSVYAVDALPTVSGAVTYTAQFTPVSKETGFYVDIIDVDNSAHTLKLNVSGTEWVTAGWPYEVNGTVYYRDQAKATAASSDKYRATDRTLTIPYTGEPGENFTVTIRNASSTLVSKHTYIIPQEIKLATTLTTDQTAPIFVKGATLTVNANIEATNIYVGADAKLVVESNKTLTAGTVFLRTVPSSAAELVNNGTIVADVYYTRIVDDKSGYFQFGLPLSCSTQVQDIRLSNGNDPKYLTGSGWILRRYDEASRANYGDKGEDGNGNWVTLAKTATITGGMGYEMYSGVNYYREFYFPVDLSKLGNTVHVDYTAGAQPTNNGWNVIVSPLTHTYTQTPQPEMNISWMQLDGSFLQEPLTEVAPAMTFAYQAANEESIVFDGEAVTVPTLAPLRRAVAAEETERIQWIHLDIADANGQGDQTSIYSHPTRYDAVYQTGIDVAKQSLTASRAIIYSSHAYGDMAFAGVADTLLEQGVALTVYSPSAQELTISMRENNWLNRMEYVWLIDHETGVSTDLLWDTYTFDATEGTTRGRFTIEGIFRVPQITTDIENGEVLNGEMMKVRKVLINQKMYIIRGDQMYDATGKKVSK